VFSTTLRPLVRPVVATLKTASGRALKNVGEAVTVEEWLTRLDLVPNNWLVATGPVRG